MNIQSDKIDDHLMLSEHETVFNAHLQLGEQVIILVGKMKLDLFHCYVLTAKKHSATDSCND